MASKYAYQCLTEENIFGATNLDQNEDLGDQIRKQVKKLTNPAILTTEETVTLNKNIDALERLANNTHAKKYQRIHSSTATGLTAEQCTKVLSSEFLQYLQEDKKDKQDSKEKGTEGL